MCQVEFPSKALNLFCYDYRCSSSCLLNAIPEVMKLRIEHITCYISTLRATVVPTCHSSTLCAQSWRAQYNEPTTAALLLIRYYNRHYDVKLRELRLTNETTGCLNPT